MFFAHSTHEVVVLDEDVVLPHVVPYWAWTMATRMVLKLMSRTMGAIRIMGITTPHTVTPFTRPFPLFPSAIKTPSSPRNVGCNTFHASGRRGERR